VPHIAFSAKYLVLAYRQDSKWIVETADPSGDGLWNSLAFDTAGRAVIAYRAAIKNQPLRQLKVAVRQPTGAWTSSVIETGAGYGVQAAIAFSASGNPAIVHGNGTVRFVEFLGDWTTGSGAWVAEDLTREVRPSPSTAMSRS
jgi:hypothetical protein